MKRLRLNSGSLALAALISFSAIASAQPRPMTLVDVINVPQVSDPQLSPDGRQVLFVRSDANWKANRRISHIWRIDATGTGLIRLTSGPDGESSPRWSPDGHTIAFIAKRATEPEAAAQVWLIANAGGEARALTSHPTAVSNLIWSPDGGAIYFRAPDAKSDERKAREKAKDDVIVFDEDFQQQHVWKVAVATKKETRITEGAYSVLSYNLSNDGTKIAMHRAPSPLMGDIEQSEVWVSGSDGQDAVAITHNHVQESDASLSPDNTQLLFLSQANKAYEPYFNRKIFTVPASGGPAQLLMPDLTYEVDHAEWSKDGKSIYFLANMGVHAELFSVPARGGKPEQLTSGKHSLTGWTYSPVTNAHIYTELQMTSPGEVWIDPASGGSAPHKVTSVFDNLTRDFRLPKQERIEWKGADGVTVEGLIYYPLDYTPGQRYPLAVQTHGGPQASDKFGFGGSQNYVAVLAAKGYAVLQPNYRGSTGYGDPFVRDMVGHYFQNAHLDVMAGVDELI
ncbi:MAG: prolyl oligopeptidase family serine peptidase, partial [Bryobacteraceae bacterium]